MIFENDFNPVDRDFLDENNQIRKYLWKDYWRYWEQDPENRREVRHEKAATKRRIHQRNRRSTRGELKKLKNNFSSN